MSVSQTPMVAQVQADVLQKERLIFDFWLLLPLPKLDKDENLTTSTPCSNDTDYLLNMSSGQNLIAVEIERRVQKLQLYFSHKEQWLTKINWCQGQSIATRGHQMTKDWEILLTDEEQDNQLACGKDLPYIKIKEKFVWYTCYNIGHHTSDCPVKNGYNVYESRVHEPKY